MAEEALAAVRFKLSELQERKAGAVAVKAAVEERQKDSAVKAMMAGDVLQHDPVDAERHRKAMAEISAVDDALPLVTRQIELAKAELETAQQHDRAADLAFYGAEQSSALADLQAALATLAPHVARLRAIDEARSHLIGARFSMSGPNLPRPFSGAAITTKLLAGIVERLLPSELSEASLVKLTASSLTSIKQQLQESLRG